jgi:hypothetical protein
MIPIPIRFRLRIRLGDWPRKLSVLALTSVSGGIWFLIVYILMAQLLGKHHGQSSGDSVKDVIITESIFGFFGCLTAWMAYRIGFRRRSSKGTYLSPYFIIGIGVVLESLAVISAATNPAGFIYIPAPFLLGLGAIYAGTMLVRERKETREQIGECEHCRSHFQYVLIHNGFNDSAYAYCDSCGKICFLNCWYNQIPKNAHLQVHKCITPELEPLLEFCSCGGHFKFGASPRCPTCRQELSAENATTYFEQNAPGSAKGWRWQKNWTDCYSVIIENQAIKDNWKSE